MISSMIARAATFIVVVLVYAVILLSIMGYYDAAPTSLVQTNTARAMTTTSYERPSNILSQELDIEPSVVNIHRPNHSPLANFDRKTALASSGEIVHTSIVFIDDFEADRDQAYLNMAIVPRLSVIPTEPVITRSGDVVRNVVSWAWTYASRGAISTYNDAFRVKQQARHVLL